MIIHGRNVYVSSVERGRITRTRFESSLTRGVSALCGVTGVDTYSFSQERNRL